MKKKVLVKICSENINDICKFCFVKKINIYESNNSNNDVVMLIDEKDLNKLKLFYKIKVLKVYSIENLLINIKSSLKNIILVIFSIIIFIILKNIIIEVNINTTNKELHNNLEKTLANYGVYRLSFQKDFIKLSEIKDKILKEYKEHLEYFEIERVGMTYEVKLVERKHEKIEQDHGVCDVIATSDGMITKIISSQGTVLKEKNNYVKEGDTIISGNIYLNDEIKGSLCAKGSVYAQKWYTIDISVPLSYEKKRYTRKFRYNFLIEANNKDYKIFKSRFKKYDSDKNTLISLLGYKLYLLKEYEYTNDTYTYNDTELDNKIDELIYEKLELNLSDQERIIDKNILKKEENNSRINIEIFVVAEKLISKQIVYN